MVERSVDQPNPVKVLWGIVKVLRATEPPNPHGSESFDAFALKEPLDALASGGIPGLAESRGELDAFIKDAETVSPDMLTRSGALALWINVYNAGAMRLAIEAFEAGRSSVLRVPGAFGRPIVDVNGESLSLDAIEHGKLRRFGDPRIHGALVCGSLSCPTLRMTPYSGSAIDAELHDQMVSFLKNGGAVLDSDTLYLSRIFQWFGRDFVSPQKMPTFLPTTRQSVLKALQPWLTADHQQPRKVDFQHYDWGLACNIA